MSSKPVCETYQRCTKCRKSFAAEKINPDKHSRLQKKCCVCKTMYDTTGLEHLCYVTEGSDLKEIKEGKYHEGCSFIYDIETTSDNKTGKLPAVIICMCKEDGSLRKTWKGLDCIEHFCDFILSGQFRRCFFLGHNSTNFDLLIVQRCIINRGFKISFIPRGTGMLYMRVHKYSLEFNDTYKLHACGSGQTSTDAKPRH